MGRKVEAKMFCFSCQCERPKDAGLYVVRGRVKRWRCQICAEHRNISIYASKEKQDVSRNSSVSGRDSALPKRVVSEEKGDGR